MVAAFTEILKFDPNSDVTGHLECELTAAVVIPSEKLIDMAVLETEANAPPQLVKFSGMAAMRAIVASYNSLPPPTRLYLYCNQTITNLYEHPQFRSAE